ncbi:hypothetical protein GGH93_002743 [Coemansia aciculifera]|nr:hypothetical protein GGH93_002743 [Coemansia aciculifera]
MAAYGVGLLHVALNGLQVDRRQITQVGNILAMLCASLSDMRDRHRDAVSKILEAKVDAYRRSQCAGVEMRSQSVRSLECLSNPSSSTPRWQRGGISGSVSRERSHPYSRDTLRHDASWQQIPQLHSHDTVREVDSTSAPIHAQISSNGSGQESGQTVKDAPVTAMLVALSDSDSTSEENSGVAGSSSVANSTAAAVVSTQASRQVKLPADLSRRSVVRDGLLRQGFSKSAIAAYFDRFSKSTNRNYDKMWKFWAVWCVGNDIDPCRRSEADLDTYILERTVVDRWRKQMRAQVKLVWSIVEGRPPPAKNKRVVKCKNN